MVLQISSCILGWCENTAFVSFCGRRMQGEFSFPLPVFPKIRHAKGNTMIGVQQRRTKNSRKYPHRKGEYYGKYSNSYLHALWKGCSAYGDSVFCLSSDLSGLLSGAGKETGHPETKKTSAAGNAAVKKQDTKTTNSSRSEYQMPAGCFCKRRIL